MTDGTASDAGSGSDGGASADSGTLIMRCINDEMCPEDKYCRAGENRNQSVCAFGCRADNCGAGQLCEPERRVCVRDELRCR